MQAARLDDPVLGPSVLRTSAESSRLWQASLGALDDASVFNLVDRQRSALPERVVPYAHVRTLNHSQDVGLQVDELRQVARQRGWSVSE